MSQLWCDCTTLEEFNFPVYRICNLLDTMIVFENYQPPEMTPFSVCLYAAEEHMKEAMRLEAKAGVNKCPQTVSMKRITSSEELSVLKGRRVKTNISSHKEEELNSERATQSPKRKRTVRFAKNLVKVAYLPQKHMITARNSRKGTWDVAPFHDEYWDGNKRAFRKIPLSPEEVKEISASHNSSNAATSFWKRNIRKISENVNISSDNSTLYNLAQAGKLLRTELFNVLFS